ncbi:type II toxin-antitoxin system RelE/ParE family toxin [Methylococcus sp. Mc7]|nr:type II toxin-antitoxin system RelE/ParE family toxin [Methylococcus sp. Mc7]QXP86115.1 type II toxin-antitoxin system RelE/ParE family toxin [Methylococcus sp. Mc7]
MRWSLSYEPATKKRVERLADPRVPAAQLSGRNDRYQIKLRSAGYRLVYEVRDSELLVLVVAVGKRERDAVYQTAVKR